MNPDQGIQETLFRSDNEDWYRQYYRVAVNNAIKMVSEALPSHMNHKREEIIAKLQAFLNEEVFFRTMSELVSAQGPLSVFCHGDCWTNNILFQDQPNSDTEVNILFNKKNKNKKNVHNACLIIYLQQKFAIFNKIIIIERLYFILAIIFFVRDNEIYDKPFVVYIFII